MCRRAHLHTIDASPFSRLEQLDANRTPSPYQEANGLVHDRPEVEASRRRGRRGGRRSVPPGGLRLPRDARRPGPRPEVRVGRIFATSGPRCGVAASESTATPHAPKEFDIQRGGRARRLVCAPPPFSCLSPVNTEAVGGRLPSCAMDYLLATAAQELIFGRNVAPRALRAFVQTHCRRRCCGCRRHHGYDTTSLKPVSASHRYAIYRWSFVRRRDCHRANGLEPRGAHAMPSMRWNPVAETMLCPGVALLQCG